MSNKPEPKLEDKLRGVLRLKQYSPRTEETYIQWYKRFVLFQAQATGRMRHPAEMGTEEVAAFLTNLAVNKNLTASSQNQALNALVFLYREVLKMQLEGLDAVRAKRSKYLPEKDAEKDAVHDGRISAKQVAHNRSISTLLTPSVFGA